jgi:hypothetical protein
MAYGKIGSKAVRLRSDTDTFRVDFRQSTSLQTRLPVKTQAASFQNTILIINSNKFTDIKTYTFTYNLVILLQASILLDDPQGFLHKKCVYVCMYVCIYIYI